MFGIDFMHGVIEDTFQFAIQIGVFFVDSQITVFFWEKAVPVSFEEASHVSICFNLCACQCYFIGVPRS